MTDRDFDCCLPPHTSKKNYGLCLACGSIEVELDHVDGIRDFSHIGESPVYPIGYGCEVCA